MSEIPILLEKRQKDPLTPLTISGRKNHDVFNTLSTQTIICKAGKKVPSGFLNYLCEYSCHTHQRLHTKEDSIVV